MAGALAFEIAREPGTVNDLLADAHSLGFPATKRLIDDWIGLGLLGHPERRSGGAGGGSDKARFSAEQRSLFRLLATKRHEVKYVTSLCNVPVAFWLWWDGFVSTHQVQQAMKTWAGGRVSRPSLKAVREQARQLTNFFDDVDAYRDERMRLIDLLVKIGHGGKLDEPDELRQAIVTVFDPGDTGRVFGAGTASIPVDAFVSLLSARIRGMDRARNWASVEELEQARAVYRNTRWQWARDRPELARNPIRAADAALFKPEAVQDLFDKVCIDLAFILGLQAHRAEGSSVNGGVRP